MLITSDTPKNIIIKNEPNNVIVKPIQNEVKIYPTGNYVVNIGSGARFNLPNQLNYVAGENLPLNAPVILNEDRRLQVAKASNITHSDSFVGLVLFSTPIDLTATVLSFGLLFNDSWNWELNKPIFLGVNGDLTQIIDNGISFLLHIAKPITTNSILILQNNPILL